MKEYVLYALLFTSLIYYVTAKKGDLFKPLMSVRLERCTSYCNPNYCNISTVCRPLNRTSKFVYMDIYLYPGVKIEAPVYLKIVTLKKFATVYRPHMVDFKTELCKELSLASHPLLFGLAKGTGMRGNLMDPCPLKHGHRRTKPRITNLYDFVSPIFQIIPSGEWRFDVVVSVERNGSDVVVVSWNDYYETKSLTAEEF